jgi:hypothetical protein
MTPEEADQEAKNGSPIRLRLSRRAGFSLQRHSRAMNGLSAVNVARPSKWGNPFLVGKQGTAAECVALYQEFAAECVALYRGPVQAPATRELRGKNLACWCALDAPCHADVLLEMANRESEG